MTSDRSPLSLLEVVSTGDLRIPRLNASERHPRLQSHRKARVKLIQISTDFSTMILHREGEAARDWLEALPYTLEDLLDRWHLRLEGPPMYGM